jgi:hypothetical protein
MSLFYSAGNCYATETDIGFANTWYIYAFDSKANRDAYVESAADRATRAVKRAEIGKYLGPVKPFSGRGYIVDTYQYSDFIYPKGYVGRVQIAHVGQTQCALLRDFASR